MRKGVKRLGRLHYKFRHLKDHPAHEQYRKARNKYAEEIDTAKKEHWLDWLENVTGETIWTAHKQATTDYGPVSTMSVPSFQSTINASQTLLTSNEEKGKELFNSFFPSQDVSYIIEEDARYPSAAFEYRVITNRQVERAIGRLSPYKAPGPDGVPNTVFKYNANLITPFLGLLFQATFRLNYYPENWKTYKTVVLRKPGKPDYTKAKAYRGIALLNTMSKVLSACVAEDLVYNAEKLKLLPDGQYGGRPGRTTTDAIHSLINFTKNAWRKKEVVLLLFLDVKGTFPSVVIQKLLHEMRMLGIPKEYTDWLRTKLSSRSTTICFDDYQTSPIQIYNGIDQGCPLSVILYLFYNSSLLNIARKEVGETAVGFMDDVTLGVRAENFEKAANKILDMLVRPKGAHEWSETHKSAFEHDKDALLALTRNRTVDEDHPSKTRRITRPTIKIGHHQVESTKTVKYLGVYLDEELRFNEHTAYTLGKGTKWALQVRRLARPKDGIPAKYMRVLYKAVVVPKILYAADIFCANKLGSKNPSSGFLGQLARIQRMLTLQITGALKSSATDTLDILTDLLPFKLMVEKACHSALIRMAALPASHPLFSAVSGKSEYRITKHRTPIQHLRHHFSIDTSRIEKIPLLRQHPKRFAAIPTRIDKSSEDAVWTFLLKPPPQIRIFTDGSGYGGAIGEAAILQQQGKSDRILQLHLGPASEHTVYEGELVGILLAFHLISTNRGNTNITIHTDNQATLLAINTGNSKPASYLVDEIRQRYEACTNPLKKTPNRIEFQWTPAHVGIAGNEKADSYAKEASIGTGSPKDDIPLFLRRTLPLSTSAIKQQFAAQTKKEHKNAWAASPRSTRLNQYFTSTPSKSIWKTIEQLPKKHATLYSQLITGHTTLRAHLHRINKAESPLCPKCLKCKETIHHYILRCPAFEIQWQRMQLSLGHNARSLPTLLGQGSALPHLFRFISKTRRFKSMLGEIEAPEQLREDGGRKKPRREKGTTPRAAAKQGTRPHQPPLK